MIYSISDLHLDYTGKKSMELFGDNWENYEERLFENWKKIIQSDDYVLIPGDISWAMTPKEAYNDLVRIEKLPGTKIIMKGNHDYWWGSLKKIEDLGFKTIKFLQNNSYNFKNIHIFGTRGWLSKDSIEFNKNDEKVFNRELARLELSYNTISKKDGVIIALLHYPPFNRDKTLNDFGNWIISKDIDYCLYGHLHGPALKDLKDIQKENTNFICVSSDFLEFIPKLIINREIVWNEN